MDLFQDYEVNRDYVACSNHSILPLAALNNSGPYTFHIINEGDNSFLDLPATKIHGAFRIKKLVDGVAQNLTKDDDVSVVNLSSAALFESVAISINGTRIDAGSSHGYAYKTYLDALLSYNKLAKETTLSPDLWLIDSTGKLDSVKSDAKDADGKNISNRGYLARKLWITNELKFETYLNADLFTIDKLWPPNANITITLERNSDNFLLLSESEDKFIIEMTQLRLLYRKIKLSEPIYKSVLNGFSSNKIAKFKIVRSSFRPYLIPKGTTSTTIPNIFRGVKPFGLIVVLVDADAFNSKKNKNPWNLLPYKKIALYVNGETIPNYPLTMDTSDKLVSNAASYRWFLDNIGTAHSNDSNSITENMFCQGFTVSYWDLSANMSNGAVLFGPTIASGDLSLEWDKPLDKPVNVLVIDKKHDILNMDKNYNIKYSTEK